MSRSREDGRFLLEVVRVEDATRSECDAHSNRRCDQWTYQLARSRAPPLRHLLRDGRGRGDSADESGEPGWKEAGRAGAASPWLLVWLVFRSRGQHDRSLRGEEVAQVVSAFRRLERCSLLRLRQQPA